MSRFTGSISIKKPLSRIVSRHRSQQSWRELLEAERKLFLNLIGTFYFCSLQTVIEWSGKILGQPLFEKQLVELQCTFMHQLLVLYNIDYSVSGVLQMLYKFTTSLINWEHCQVAIASKPGVTIFWLFIRWLHFFRSCIHLQTAAFRHMGNM